MNKSQSWLNFFALSLRNLTTIMSFVRKNDFLDKITFCHLIQDCKSKPSTIIAKAQNVSSNTAIIKYKIRIQVPKGIRNAINLDKIVVIIYGKNN
jgi:hypothetical protein